MNLVVALLFVHLIQVGFKIATSIFLFDFNNFILHNFINFFVFNVHQFILTLYSVHMASLSDSKGLAGIQINFGCHNKVFKL